MLTDNYMELQQIFNLAIVGGAVSYFLEYLPKKFGALNSKIVTIAVCLAVGTIYALFSETTWFATVLTVLASASTVYALLLKKN